MRARRKGVLKGEEKEGQGNYGIIYLQSEVKYRKWVRSSGGERKEKWLEKEGWGLEVMNVEEGQARISANGVIT